MISRARRISLGFAMVTTASAQAGFLEDVVCPLFGCTGAPPPRIELACESFGLQGAPDFAPNTGAAARYSFSGVCASADRRNGAAYRVMASWVPSQRDPTRPNAREYYVIKANDALVFDGRPNEHGVTYEVHVIFGAFCDRDPWLYRAQCSRLGDTIPVEVRTGRADLATAPFPFNADAIAESQRPGLRAQFALANGGTLEGADAVRGVDVSATPGIGDPRRGVGQSAAKKVDGSVSRGDAKKRVRRVNAPDRHAERSDP
jgi:hypothetical protein